MSENTQSTPLFRPEAVNHNRQSLHGDILVLPRLPYSVVLAALLVLVGLIIVWLATSHYARKETVTGWVEPLNEVAKVYAPEPGIVQQLLVKQGDFVKQDQPIMVVTQARFLQDGNNLQHVLLGEYDTQREALLRQQARDEVLQNQQLLDISAQITATEKERDLIAQQLATLNQRYTLVNERATRYEDLKKAGHISASDYENQISQKLLLQEEIQTLERTAVRQQDAIAKLQAQKRLIPQTFAQQKDQYKDRLSMLAQQQSQLQSNQSYTVLAPKAGYVQNVQISEGQQISGNNTIPLMSINPKDVTLVVQLLVPIRSAGFIRPELPLNIRYDAFPYQKFGIYSGTIKQVSTAVLLPNELLNAPVTINEPVYRILAELPSTQIHAYGKAFDLQPGMTLQADIELGERSLMEWLLEPILSLKGAL